MGFKRVINLKKLKDKATKRHFVTINFYHKNQFISQNRFDIEDLIVSNGWKNISFGEKMTIFRTLFGIESGDYPIMSTNYDRSKYDFWTFTEDNGWSVCLKDGDFEKIKHLSIAV